MSALPWRPPACLPPPAARRTRSPAVSWKRTSCARSASPRRRSPRSKAFLAIEAPLAEAPAALDAFARRAGIALGAAAQRFSARAERIAAELGGADIRYDAAFGRPLDYYTGLVFEIAAAGAARPLAGGGRYDRLLTLLGARAPIPGVGFSVWLDRIAELRGEGAR